MSIDIIVEVMDHAPASLTAAERYALLVLAEDARLPSREIKHDITDEYLLARLRLSPRSWLNMRGELVRKKAIEKVEGGHNGKRARYRIPVFNQAMKGHPIGDSTTDDASELSTGFGDPTSVKGHRIGESRVTQSVTLTYIPRITPGGTTPTTTPAVPAPPIPDGGGGGSIDQEKNPHNDEARQLIASLPATHQPGRGGAAKLIAALAQLLALGWPGDVLHAKLTADLPPSVGNLGGLLAARLPVAAEYQPGRAASGGQRDFAMPPHCGTCHPQTRMLEDPETRDPLGRCPRCHPAAVEEPRRRTSATARALAEADAAGEEAKRIIAAAGRGGTYHPYQNPVDQSVYLEGIA